MEKLIDLWFYIDSAVELFYYLFYIKVTFLSGLVPFSIKDDGNSILLLLLLFGLA